MRKDKFGSRRITRGYWTLFQFMNSSDLHTPIRDRLCTLLTLFADCRYINGEKPIRDIYDVFTVTKICIVTSLLYLACCFNLFFIVPTHALYYTLKY
jgi:hypothetical protein